MKISEILDEAFSGSQRAAFRLGKNTALRGKPSATKETVLRNMGEDAWAAYEAGYKEGKQELEGTDGPKGKLPA